MIRRSHEKGNSTYQSWIRAQVLDKKSLFAIRSKQTQVIGIVSTPIVQILLSLSLNRHHFHSFQSTTKTKPHTLVHGQFRFCRHTGCRPSPGSRNSGRRTSSSVLGHQGSNGLLLGTTSCCYKRAQEENDEKEKRACQKRQSGLFFCALVKAPVMRSAIALMLLPGP